MDTKNLTDIEDSDFDTLDNFVEKECDKYRTYKESKSLIKVTSFTIIYGIKLHGSQN